MKHAYFFLLAIACIICTRLNAQRHSYPLKGIGVEPQMKILGKYGVAANFPDGKMKGGEYASVDLSLSLSKKEKKVYGKSPLPEFHLYYEGEMKNNTFNGLGKLRFTNRNTGYLNWTYTGDFIDGKADGFGELSCYFLTAKNGTITECWFRGEFENGQPTEGCLINILHKEKKRTPVIFYSGQVLFENGQITWDGYGALLRSEMDHSDPKFSTCSGVPGSLYIGQFYRGSATGFALTNTVDQSGHLGPLVSVLAGADDIFQQYTNLGLYADFMAGQPYSPPVNKQAQLYSLFPQMEAAIFKEMALTNEVIYKGMMVDNLPYGLGYVEYVGENGNFRDIGWWMQGKKLSIAKVLKNLLPDSNWLQPKTIQAFVKDCNKTWNNKLYKEEIFCTDKQTEGLYYGPVNANGFPIGWGLLHPAQTGDGYFKSYLGKFTGADPAADKSTNMGAEQLYVYSYNQQWQYNYYDPVKAAKDQYYNEFERGVFDPYFPALPFGYKRYFTRTAFAEDMFLEKRHVDYVKFERQFNQELANRPSVQVDAVYLNKSTMSNSYVQDMNGNKINMSYIAKEQLTRGDYVFIGKALYYVHDSYRNIMLGMQPSDGFWWAEQVPANVLVVRGYKITNIEHKLVYCSGCSDLPPLPTGPVTVTGSAHSGRYETNVYQNNSGGGSIVSKPIYNQISITLPPPTRKPCKVCNNRRKNEKVPLLVIGM
jgi:hypothetical protein